MKLGVLASPQDEDQKVINKERWELVYTAETEKIQKVKAQGTGVNMEVYQVGRSRGSFGMS